ncbi:unnamed protein product [Protopolystoma xenopodis]|uniref:Uncharacterized protein n=1 Tax=Protopolystoma xenopodis TaxID=117903 RepID=A0A3S5BVU8_9PLAT|nr:unnamed protein product [Protopolystoma xenopodis]
MKDCCSHPGWSGLQIRPRIGHINIPSGSRTVTMQNGSLTRYVKLNRNVSSSDMIADAISYSCCLTFQFVCPLVASCARVVKPIHPVDSPVGNLAAVEQATPSDSRLARHEDQNAVGCHNTHFLQPDC